MRVTQNGQVTIPSHIRKKMDISPGSEVDFVVAENGRVYIIKVDNNPEAKRFSRLRGAATVKLSTEEILALTRTEA